MLITSLLALCGCRRVVGLDDYRTESADGLVDSGVRDAAPSDAPFSAPHFESPPPYLTGAECESCVQANCAHRMAECLADANCTRWLEEVRERADPFAEVERSATSVNAEALSRGDAAWSDLQHGTQIGNRFYALRGCVRHECADPCAVGRDFGCTGAFDYPFAFPGPLRVRLQMTDAIEIDVGLRDWRVRACMQQDIGCNVELGSGVSDADGFLEIDLEFPAGSVRPAEVTAWFLMEDGHRFLPLVLQRTAPLLDGSVLGQSHVPTATLDAFLLAFGEQRRPDSGFLYVAQNDCRVYGARNVTAEIWVAEGGAYRACSECGILYQNDAGLPDATRTELSGLASVVFVYNVPPREVAIVVRDTESRGIVGVQHLVIRAGHAHAAMLFPASKLQLMGVPEEAR